MKNVWNLKIFIRCVLALLACWTVDAPAAAPDARDMAVFPPSLESYNDSRMEGMILFKSYGYDTKMPRKPKPDATEYLRRLLNIPTIRSMTGSETERLDFATAVLEFIIKDQPKQVKDFIEIYARDNGMNTKRCYDILARLKHLKLIHYDSDFRMYRFNSDKYFEDLSALRAFHEQIKIWNH